MDSTPFTAPRPTPTFYTETSFATKRERSQTPREKPPPPLRPPSRKTFLSFNPLFIKKESKPAIVSIKPSKKSLATPFYNPNLCELYFDQVFDVICQIGSGSFGDVYKVRCKCDNEFYAVKKSKQKFKSNIDRLNKFKEANRYEQLPYHRNCVKYIKAWEERDRLYIQTELCKTSLSDYAEEHHNISDKQIWNYLIDLLMAVKHLHDHNLIHLDIKPDNVFVNDDDVCKLGDFGLVFDLNKGNTDSAVEGDAKYLAPELMQGNFGKPADIFSLGITILELACDLDLPKGNELWHHLRSKILPEDLLKDKPEDLQFCIRWMMEPDPAMRPTVNEILNHSYVRETWQRRLQEQIELENKANAKVIKVHPPCKNFLWASDAMHAIAERSACEEDEEEEEEEEGEENRPTLVTPLDFSPPLCTHPFLEKETSFNSMSSPRTEANPPLNFSTLSSSLDSSDFPHINRSISEHDFHNNNNNNNNSNRKNKRNVFNNNNHLEATDHNNDSFMSDGSNNNMNNSNLSYNSDDNNNNINHHNNNICMSFDDSLNNNTPLKLNYRRNNILNTNKKIFNDNTNKNIFNDDNNNNNSINEKLSLKYQSDLDKEILLTDGLNSNLNNNLNGSVINTANPNKRARNTNTRNKRNRINNVGNGFAIRSRLFSDSSLNDDSDDICDP